MKINPQGGRDERRLAGEWFDGRDSAMLAFSRYEPFEPQKLLTETNDAIAAVTPADILSGDAARLQSLHRLAQGWAKQERALMGLRKALVRCKTESADPYEVAKIYREIME